MGLPRKAVLVIRIFLGIVFLTYGIIKLFGGQFYYGDWTISKKTVGGTFLVWAFYGYSPAYGRFIGLCESVPALMLLFPRTALLGAAALFAVNLNITVMDFCYGFPGVRWAALMYTILLAVLLAYDHRKLQYAFWEKETVRHVELPPVMSSARRRWSNIATVILVVIGLIFILFVSNLIAVGLNPGPEKTATDVLVQQGHDRASIKFLRSHYTGLWGIHRTAVIEFEIEGTTPPALLRVDASLANGFSKWHIDGVTKEH